MKRYLFILLSVTMSLINVSFGEEVAFERSKKLSYAPEVENSIIRVAKKVCDEVAPEYGTDDLVPVIFSFPAMKDHPVYKNRKVLSVKFMKDSTDYLEGELRRFDGGKVVVADTYKRPRYVVHVMMYEDNMEPICIQDNHNRAIIFDPSYAEFRKRYPDTRLEPFTPPSTKPGEIIVY